MFAWLMFLALNLHASTSPETSLKWLMNGNTRFVKGTLRSDGQSLEDVRRVSRREPPHAVVLACSDSRVAPEILFDQKLGEIYTVRSLGEVVDEGALASIEYAVGKLGARLLVVMGHTSCSAVEDTLSFGAHDFLSKRIQPHLQGFKGKLPSRGLALESWGQAEAVARELTQKSSLLKSKLAAGDLWIVPSLYDLSSGHVEFRKPLTNPSAAL